MPQHHDWQALTHFYDTHPLNEDSIREKVQVQGASGATLTEDTFQAYDQDHYGGVEAVDILARKANIGDQTYVLDVCCGLGGPARYLAHNYRCRVMGLDITESRIQSARRFTQLVKLDHLVDFRQGNALAMPFAHATFDVIMGQEAWVHVPDKTRLIAECTRVVKVGGRIAFTDILRCGALSSAEEDRLRQYWGGFATLETLEGYSQLLREAGWTIITREDLSEHWAAILVDRLAMYRSLHAETVRKFGEAHYQQWDDNYSFFVGLYTTKQLGGGRFIAQRAASVQHT